MVSKTRYHKDKLTTNFFKLKMSKPIDSLTRKAAISEQDTNIVVVAGAGTGKTTLLVNRILHMLLGHKRFQDVDSPILRIAAMTFTEKAASDIKIKLMDELEKIVAVINENIFGEEKSKVENFLGYIRDIYKIKTSEIERRAKKSLEDMDKALIGTIHSFAAYILRLYPIESGVAPGFIVDDGDVFDELFDKEWTKWLDKELNLTAPNANAWKIILSRLDLQSLKELTRTLSGFHIPSDSFASINNIKSSVQSFIEPLLDKISETASLCNNSNNNLLKQLLELSNTLNAVKKQGISCLHNLEYDLEKNPSSAETGWVKGFETAKRLVKDCYTLLKKLKTVDEEFIKKILNLIIPFTESFRQIYLSKGYVSFDGLLTLTRDLLKNKEFLYIREKLKKEFKAILVDEFQDTDPIQYEIVLFLSEVSGKYSQDAHNITLEKGKLFIVGDPKQSIYAFRRADIEAYEYVVERILGSNEAFKLQENFRSHSGIVDVINNLFDGRIIAEQPGLQPQYIPIFTSRHKNISFQKVEIVFVCDKDSTELKADEAREAEAEWIARWIKKNVDNETIFDKLTEKGTRKLKYRDVAILLRAFTQVRPYVEALKRYGIPYIIEGEKYFYTTLEILDFINLLRIIENPYDTIALVGILRSPFVGLTDRQIYELKLNNLLDYRKSVPDKINFKNTVEFFYDLLKRINARAGLIPVSQLITEIMDNTFIPEITAVSWQGEQKLANLWKLYQMACDMEQTESISLKTFLDRIKARIKEAKEEGESPLSDETLDVVKLLTIHKSKGLEFPVVILANMHGEVNSKKPLDAVLFDWATSTTGIVIGNKDKQVRNLQSIMIEKKLKERLREEEKRVLYVAMTRAMERLIITGAFKNDNESFMGMITQSIADVSGISINDENVKKIVMENSEISIEHFRFDGTHRPERPKKDIECDTDWSSIKEIWEKRQNAFTEAIQKPVFISPSSISREDIILQDIPTLFKDNKISSEKLINHAMLVGSVCHQVLEEWNFNEGSEALQGYVGSAVKWTNLKLQNISQDTLQTQEIEFIKKDALSILSAFFVSEAYKELQHAQILSRETPFLLQWNGQVVRGTIDIIYKTDNRIIIADYKTDTVKTHEISVKAAKYKYQKEIYTEAVKRCLKIENPEFRLIFLRAGKSVCI